MKNQLLILVTFVFMIQQTNGYAESDTWAGSLYDKTIECFDTIAISTNLLGLADSKSDILGPSDSTRDLSLHCYDPYQNQHVFQITKTENGDNGKGSRFDGRTIAWHYKDFFLGVDDTQVDFMRKRKAERFRGFMILGAGFGQFTKSPGDVDELDFDALFVSFGGGAEFRLNDNFYLTGDLGFGLGGLVGEQEIFTLNLLYKFSN